MEDDEEYFGKLMERASSGVSFNTLSVSAPESLTDGL
jgi:hypothetical protein